MEDRLYDIELARWVNLQGFDESCEFMFLNGGRIVLNGNRAKMTEKSKEYLLGYVQEMMLCPSIYQVRDWMERTHELYVSVELWRNEWWRGEVPASWMYRVFNRGNGWKELTLPDTVLYDNSIDCLKAALNEAANHI